jgi:hypothetical protein
MAIGLLFILRCFGSFGSGWSFEGKKPAATSPVDVLTKRS